MSIKRFIKNIWNNPVWSKVISAGILAIVGTIATITNWVKIKSVLPAILMFARNNYERFIIIILLIVLITIFINKIIKKSVHKKPDIRWLKKNLDSIMSENYFLMWFPLNGVMHGSLGRLSAADSLKVTHSRKIVPLFEKNIISMGYYGSIDIDKKAFDIIDNFVNRSLDKSIPEQRSLIEKVQSIHFSEIIFNCAVSTKYDV
jgi:c-di-GMP-related signal transduction protein